MSLSNPRRNPRRSLDILFQRLFLSLCWVIATFAFLLAASRFVQFRQAGFSPILVVTPVLSGLLLVVVALFLRRGQPSQERTDAAVALAMTLLFINLAVGSIWVKDPIRLFNFAPAMAICGLLQRNRRLFALTLLAGNGALVFAWFQSPFAPASVNMAITIFITCIAIGILTNALVMAMVGRVERLLMRLVNAKAEIGRLEELVPICSHCKKVRNDAGYWEQVESYLGTRTQATFSHGICPDCVSIYWPEVASRRADSNNVVSDARASQQPPPTPA